jgi:hypothetical protein
MQNSKIMHKGSDCFIILKCIKNTFVRMKAKGGPSAVVEFLPLVSWPPGRPRFESTSLQNKQGTT